MPEVEQVDQAVERVAGAVFAAAGVGGDGDHASPPSSGIVDDRRDVLEVGQVLAVQAVAGQRDPERDGADQQADDGHAERDPQVVAERGGVAVRPVRERRREGDQRAHQAERRAGANEHARAAETSLGVEVEVGQRLVELVSLPAVRA